ncbi:hypothetical protein H3C61_00575 [Candidatus Gracilibacteria bacterium]|nr:hypothetical protein [Candidatus Gracilibacteria bacterium]
MITKTQIENLYGDYFDYYKSISETNKSFPFFFSFDNAFYDYQKETILVYGQETFGYPSKHWVIKTNNKNLYFDNTYNFKDCIDINNLCYKLFDFPDLINIDKSIQKHFNSPFWNFLKELRKQYKREKYNLIWSNLIKFDINGKRIDEDIIKKLGKKFIEEHTEILNKEINFINPEKIIILGKQKDKNTIYNKILLNTISSNFPSSIINDYINVDKFNKIYHISHPNYLNRNKQKPIDIINKIILNPNK